MGIYCMNKTIKSIIILQKNLKKRLDEYNNIIIELLNDIQTNFYNKKISFDNYNNSNSKLNILFNNLEKITNDSKIKIVYKAGMNSINKKLMNIELEIKNFFKNTSLKKIVNILEFMISKDWNKRIDKKEL